VIRLDLHTPVRSMAMFAELESRVLREGESLTDLPEPAQGCIKKRFALAVGLFLASALVGAVVIKPSLKGCRLHTTGPVGGWMVKFLEPNNSEHVFKHMVKILGPNNSEHVFKHMSARCVQAMKEMDESYGALGGTNICGGMLNCKMTWTIPKATEPMKVTKCFPWHCKEKNIEKELNADDEAPLKGNISVLCYYLGA